MPDDKSVQDKTDQATQPIEKREKVEVEERPISEADAKKFAGQGDYKLPVSPLDNLDVPTEGAEAEEQTKKMAQPTPSAAETAPTEPIVSPTTPVNVAESAPIKPVVSPTQADVAKPAPSPVVPPKVDLEKKAKDMLKKLDTVEVSSGGKKPKKKRSSAVNRMALAAVLMVLMGAGGIVGLNLFKLNQSTEDRSQAAGEGGCSCEGTWTQDKYCQLSCIKPDGNKCYAAGTTDGYGSYSAFDGTSANLSCSCFCCNPNGQNGAVIRKLGDANCSTSCTESGYAGVSGTNACGVDEPISACSCVSWDADGCGVGCTFPADTQTKVDNAVGTCGAKVAVCNRSGTSMYVSIEDIDESNICMTPAKLAACNNPQANIPCINPTPTPTPTPGAFSCNSIIKNKPAPAIGDVVVFTCNGSGEVDHYEYQYKIGTGTFGTLSTANDKTKSVGLTIAQAGDYVVECRACQSTDSSDCTVWGLADK